MTRIRRLYVYGICAVSLLFFATGIENLIRLLLQTLAGADATPWLWLSRGQFRQQVSFFVALTLIDGPVWIAHWTIANRTPADDERASQLRRFYLYLVMAGSLIFFIPGLIGLIRIPLWALLGAAASQSLLSALGAPVGLLAVTVPIWVYHRRLACSEAEVGGEDGGLATIRRLYYYLAAFGTVIFLLINEARLGTSVWEGLIRQFGSLTLGGENWARAALPSYGVAVLVFLAAWWWHVAQTELIASGSAGQARLERRSLLRRLYLYGLVLVCIVVVVINASTLLDDLLRALLGSPDPTGTGRGLLDAAGQPLVWAAVFGAFWLYQRRWLQRESSRAAEAAEVASLRRLYYYLVAAIGLTVAAYGAILLLSTLLSLLSLAPDQRSLDWFRDRISLGATLTLLGGAIWFGHWQHQQSLLSDSRVAGAERTALWRRLYLYAACFVTVVALLVDAASVLYQLLLLALGDRSTLSLIEAIRTPFSVIVVSGMILAYHWRLLRFDLLAEVVKDTSVRPFQAVVVLQAADREKLEPLLAQMAALASDQVEVSVLQGSQLDRQVKRQLSAWLGHADRREG